MPEDPQHVDVRDNPDEQRYEAWLDGRVVAFSRYRVINDRVVFLHTETDEELEGQGIGGRLVQGALDDVRSSGRRITSKCPFVSSWLDRHPEYADLAATTG